jgi:hypothetical protein
MFNWARWADVMKTVFAGDQYLGRSPLLGVLPERWPVVVKALGEVGRHCRGTFELMCGRSYREGRCGKICCPVCRATPRSGHSDLGTNDLKKRFRFRVRHRRSIGLLLDKIASTDGRRRSAGPVDVAAAASEAH